jgi:endonuclease/exonuclease/phosphatase family metal-dependent hydrolase
MREVPLVCLAMSPTSLLINQIRIFLILCFFLAGTTFVFAAGDKPLRVVAWNIEWFPGKSLESTPEEQEAQIALVQKEIERLDPDILIASEIRDWDAFEKAIARVPDLRIHVVSNFVLRETGVPGSHQIAIASKLRCRAAFAEAFSPHPPAISRGFAFAALRHPKSGELLMVYGVHLKSNRSRNDFEMESNFRQRNESTEQVLSHMALMERLTFFNEPIAGWIWGGDFNTNHDGQFGDRVLERAVEAGFWNSWSSVPQGNRLTWRGNNQFPGTTFDYILTRGLGAPVAAMGGTPEAASDHDAVILEIP